VIWIPALLYGATSTPAKMHEHVTDTIRMHCSCSFFIEWSSFDFGTILALMLLAFIYVFCLCTNAAKAVWFVSPLGIHVPENIDLKPRMLTWLTCKEQFGSQSRTRLETSQWQLVRKKVL
jgi:hypothetical protein